MNPELMYMLSASFRVSLITLVNNLLVFYGVSVLLKRKNTFLVMIILTIIKNFGYNVLISNVLSFYFGDSSWLTILNVIVLSLFFVAYIVVAYWTFDEDLLMVMFTLIVAEVTVGFFSVGISTIFNLIEKRENIWVYWDEFMILDFVNVALVSICYITIFRIISPYIKKLICKLLGYRKTIWCITLYFVLSGFVSWIDNSYFKVIIIMWILWFSCLLAGMFYFIHNYSESMNRNKSFLVTQKNMLEVHYGVVLKQIEQMNTSRKILNKQMEEIDRLKDEKMKKENITIYINQLKQSYDEIKAGIYCNDWLLDAVLYHKVQSFEVRKFTLEISMQGYDRGKIEEKDLVQIVMALLDYGEEKIEEKEKEDTNDCTMGSVIALKLCRMKNQLLIECSYPFSVEDKKLKKKIRYYLKKYDGSCCNIIKNQQYAVVVSLSTSDSTQTEDTA